MNKLYTLKGLVIEMGSEAEHNIYIHHSCTCLEHSVAATHSILHQGQPLGIHKCHGQNWHHKRYVSTVWPAEAAMNHLVMVCVG